MMKKLFCKGISTVLSVAIWVAVLLVMITPMTGCTISASQVTADGQAVAAACQSIAAQLAVTDPELAANLTKAANGLLAATQNWQSGSPIAIFNDAAAAVEAALAAIPVTSAYAALVAIAVAAVDVLIANINPASAKMTVAQSNTNPYLQGEHRAVIKHRFGRSVAGDLKAAFNDAIQVNHLAVVPLR